MLIVSRLRLGLVVAAFAAFAVACGGASDDSATAASTSNVTAAPIDDPGLASELADPPEHLTQAFTREVVQQALSPATTARLHLLNDFIAAGEQKWDASDPDASYDALAFNMEAIFWGTPRDLTSAPAGFGGQTFATSVAWDDTSAGPSRLKVIGTAASAYDLDLTIAGVTVKVGTIPAGSTAEATAGLVAKALQTNIQAITDSLGGDACMAPIGGDHSSEVSGVDDVEVSTSGATVTIVVAMNG